jgi:hypothetical protein
LESTERGARAICCKTSEGVTETESHSEKDIQTIDALLKPPRDVILSLAKTAGDGR